MRFKLELHASCERWRRRLELPGRGPEFRHYFLSLGAGCLWLWTERMDTGAGPSWRAGASWCGHEARWGAR